MGSSENEGIHEGPSPCLSTFLPRGGSVGHRIGFDPGHQMVALLEQAVQHLTGGVVGIGDKVEGNLDSQDIEQAEHLVEQGTLVAIGPYQPSWMRTASGTEKTLLAACTSKPTACME